MKEILKTLLQIIKEEKELKKYKATLAKMPYCYEALEMLLKKVEITGAEIEIKHPDGSIMTIKPKEQEQYKSFREKFNERHQ